MITARRALLYFGGGCGWGGLGVCQFPQTHLLSGPLCTIPWIRVEMEKSHQNPYLRIPDSSSVILKVYLRRSFDIAWKSHMLFKIVNWILHYFFVNIFFNLKILKMNSVCRIALPFDVHFPTKKKKSCQFFITHDSARETSWVS